MAAVRRLDHILILHYRVLKKMYSENKHNFMFKIYGLAISIVIITLHGRTFFNEIIKRCLNRPTKN